MLKPYRLRLNEMQFFSEGGDNPPVAPEGGEPNVATPEPTPPANPEPPVTFTQEQMDAAKKEMEEQIYGNRQ